MVTITSVDREKLRALFKWYMQEVGESLISVLVVSREGLIVDILTRDQNKDDEKRFFKKKNIR